VANSDSGKKNYFNTHTHTHSCIESLINQSPVSVTVALLLTMVPTSRIVATHW